MELGAGTLRRPLTGAVEERIVDGAVLCVVVGLSLLLYVGELGFYSDDWVFLGILHRTPDQSLPGLIEGLWSGDEVIRQRPVQVLYLSVLYRLFGLDPLPYHVANASALLASVLVLNAVLRSLRQPRALALAVPALYAVMPNFSSDRFWIAAHQATLSVLFLLLGAWLALRGLTVERRSRFVATQIAAVACFVLSGLAYEVTVPLIGLAAALMFAHAKKSGISPRRLVPLAWMLGLALIALMAFKLGVSVRVAADTSALGRLETVAVGAPRVNFGVYGVGLPYVLWWIVGHALDAAVVAVAAAVSVVVAWAVHRAYTPDVRRSDPRHVLVGAITFVLGYAIFLVSTDVEFSSTSLGNRIGIAAALGVAGMFVGMLAWLLPRNGFAAAVGVLCGAMLLVTNTLARFWESAADEQGRVVAALTAAIPALAPGSTVIIDGICLERGGAYVFTGKRDVTGVLQIHYGAPRLRGSAVTTTVPRAQPTGLRVFTFREPDVFPYGPNLVVFDARRGEAHRLVDREAAREYFAASGFSPGEDCLGGFAWRGETPALD